MTEGRSKKVIKRIYAIFEDHRDAADSKVKLAFLLEAPGNMPREGQEPVPGSRQIHLLPHRLFEELVEEPVTSFSPRTGSRYHALR